MRIHSLKVQEFFEPQIGGEISVHLKTNMNAFNEDPVGPEMDADNSDSFDE
jgi:hypothetical protein